jgi:ribosomal protein S18 acetylase RimI-like enzyme
MEFRKAQLKDVPGIMRVRLSVRENELLDSSSITDTDCVEYLKTTGGGWVCSVKNEIVGFSMTDEINHSIWALFVLPEYEGQGIGKKLLNEALKHLESIGAKTVTLSTEINTRAEKFYLQQGWSPGIVDKKGERHFKFLFQ